MLLFVQKDMVGDTEQPDQPNFDAGFFLRFAPSTVSRRSKISSRPPRMLHEPISGGFRRSESNTRPPSSTTSTPTPTRGAGRSVASVLCVIVTASRDSSGLGKLISRLEQYVPCVQRYAARPGRQDCRVEVPNVASE